MILKIVESSLSGLKPDIHLLMKDTNLHSLSTGAVSIICKDIVNCENAESVGLSMQQSLGNVNFTDATIKRKDQLRSLAKSIKIDGKNSIF